MTGKVLCLPLRSRIRTGKYPPVIDRYWRSFRSADLNVVSLYRKSRDREERDRDRSRSHDMEYRSKDERRSHKESQHLAALTPQRSGSSQNTSRHEYSGDSRTLSPHGRNHRDRERERERDRERERYKCCDLLVFEGSFGIILGYGWPSEGITSSPF